MKKLFSNRSINMQLIMGMVIVIALTTTVSSIVLSHFSLRTFKENLENRGHGLITQLARDSRVALLFTSRETANEATRFATSDPDVAISTIYTAEKSILSSAGPGKDEFSNQVSLPIDTEHVSETDDFWLFSAPVYFEQGEASPFDVQETNSHFLGYVQLLYSKNSLKSIRTQLLRTNITLMLVMTIALIWTLALLTRRTTLPLRHLANLLHRARSGERGLSAAPGGPSDVAHMNESFNQMMRALESHEKEVEEARDRAMQELDARKKAEAERIQAMNEKQTAIDSNLAKSMFVANMSHELRTPLNSVIVLSDLLRQQLSAKQLEFTNIIHSSATHLLGLIDNILDFSQIESGKIQLSNSPFSLPSLLESVQNIVMPQVKTKAIDWNLYIDPALPSAVIGDEQRVRQMLINLVGNSVKFTSQGRVSLSARLLRREKCDATVQFEITDTGIGISEDDQKRIFGKFIRAENDAIRRRGGTGLGLSITHDLCDLMKGRLAVESQLEKGSRFTLDLTFSVCDAQAPDVPAVAIPPLTQKLRILVAEDDEINQYVIQELLRRHNHLVTMADNGQSAVDAFTAEHFDLLLLDYQMPDFSGLEVAKQLRDLENKNGLARTPIIILTADATRAVIEQCRDFVDIVETKPILPSKFQHILSRVFTVPAPYTPDSSPTSSGENNFADLDLDILQQLVTLDRSRVFLSDLKNKFIAQTRMNLSRLVNALEADDVELARKVTHQLKGGGRSMGTKRFIDELEEKTASFNGAGINTSTFQEEMLNMLTTTEQQIDRFINENTTI